MDSNVLPDADSLTIEYSLKRSEIFRSFWRSICASPKFRNTVLVYSIIVGVSPLFLRVLLSQPITSRELIKAFLGTVGAFVFTSLWISIRGKTAKRTLTVSGAGISTEIGRIKAQIPWNNVKVVQETPQFVLIARANGNSFFIPNRAFGESVHRDQFLNAIQDWVDRGRILLNS